MTRLTSHLLQFGTSHPFPTPVAVKDVQASAEAIRLGKLLLGKYCDVFAGKLLRPYWQVCQIKQSQLPDPTGTAGLPVRKLADIGEV